jgi:DNA-binding CsgD family transcriptional regulator
MSASHGSVFTKTGTRNQRELVRVAMASVI